MFSVSRHFILDVYARSLQCQSVFVTVRDKALHHQEKRNYTAFLEEIEAREAVSELVFMAPITKVMTHFRKMLIM